MKHSLVGVEVSEFRVDDVHVGRAKEPRNGQRRVSVPRRVFLSTHLSHSYRGLKGAHWTERDTSPILVSALVWAVKERGARSVERKRAEELQFELTFDNVDLRSSSTDPSSIGVF